MHIPYRIIFAEYLDCMEKMPRYLHLTKRALNSSVLLPDGVRLKISPKGWVPQQGHMRPKTLSTPPSFQNIIHFNLCLPCSKGLLQKYEQDLLLNWSKGYRKHAAFNAKFGEILQHISYGRLNCTI